MMKKILFSVLILGFTVTSCQFFQRNKNLNDIIEIVNDVEIIVNKYDNNVQSALDSQKFDYIITVADAAMAASDVKLEQLETILVPANEQNLKSAAISYIKALQNVINAEKEYSKLTTETKIERAQYIDSLNLKAIDQTEVSRLAYIEQVNSLK